MRFMGSAFTPHQRGNSPRAVSNTNATSDVTNEKGEFVVPPSGGLLEPRKRGTTNSPSIALYVKTVNAFVLEPMLKRGWIHESVG